jgi:hypothetical protein
MTCPYCKSSEVSARKSRELCDLDDSPSTWSACLSCTRENKCHFTDYEYRKCGMTWDDT